MVCCAALPTPLEMIEAALVPSRHAEEITLRDSLERLFKLSVGVAIGLFTLPLRLLEGVTYFPMRDAFQTAVDGYGPAWDRVDLDGAIKLHQIARENFKWGAATCDYQNMGAQALPNAQWAHFKTPEQHPMQFDIWGREEEMITKLQELKLNAFRFSIEWSAVEPEEGVFDFRVVKRYATFAKKLKDSGIEPMPTLHHFSEPHWFAEKGGFEREVNIESFLNFSSIMAEAMDDYVETWCTINEPGIFSFMGWVLGEYPPAKCGDFQTAGTVLKNMLLAHCCVYDAIKKITFEKAKNRGEGTQKRAQLVADKKVGITHQVLRFAPELPFHVPAALGARYLNKIIDDPVVEFFKTGKFSYQLPFLANVTARVNNVRNKIDFIGVQSYVQPRLGGYIWNIQPVRLDGEDETQMPFHSDPAAIYRALKRVSEIGKPMIVTETGIATDDDAARERHMKRTLYSISRALQEGMDVRGFLPWTLTKNNEWHLNDGPDFGLCDSETLDPKPGAAPFFAEAQAYRTREENAFVV